MLDQYRQDLNSDNDHLGEGRFQTSRRKVVFTLAGAALALLFFLFIIGAFRSEEEIASEKETTVAVASELVDLQARVEKLEQLVGANVLMTKLPTQEVPQATNTDKLIIAANDNTMDSTMDSNMVSDMNHDPMAAYQQQDAQTMPAPAETRDVPPPAPQKAAPKSYVIQKGDTLSKISQKFYGTTKKWKMIYEANRDRINNINNLKVGAQIVIPQDDSAK